MPMQIAVWILRLLTFVFFAGLAGSAVVVAISFVEDFLLLLGLDKHSERSH
jgi:hypothetical protein